MKIWVLTAAFVNFYRLRGFGFFFYFFPTISQQPNRAGVFSNFFRALAADL